MVLFFKAAARLALVASSLSFCVVQGAVTINIQQTATGVSFTIEPNGFLNGPPGSQFGCAGSDAFFNEQLSFGLLSSSGVDCYDG